MTPDETLPRGRPRIPRIPRRANTRHRAGIALAILIAATAGPALGDPAGTAAGSTPCWTPGAAPGLFSWTATPGIACRDNADGGLPPSGPRSGGSAAQSTAPDPSRTDPRTQFTFSGSAYVGVAAVF